MVFIATHGQCWIKDATDNPITKETRKLLNKLGSHHQELGFYELWYTFAAIGEESLGQVAVHHIMGHARRNMVSDYRGRISYDQLCAVTEYLRHWLFE